MKKTALFCILSFIGNFSADASAQTLSCSVSFLTGDAKGMSTRLHSATEHPDSPFFQFSITDQTQHELYLHQNFCIKGKDIGDPALKGTLCLLVSSGIKLLTEAGRAPDEDLYLSASGKVLTFQVSQFSRSSSRKLHAGQSYLNGASEVVLPVSGYRGNFSGNQRGGISSLTITCG